MALRIGRALGPVGFRTLSTTSHRPQTEAAKPGLNFDLGEDHLALQSLCRRFAREEVLPVVEHHDRTGEFPWDIYKKAHALGICNILTPTWLGASGLGAIGSVILSDEVGFACTGVALALGSSLLGQMPLIAFGNEQQQKNYLGRMVDEPLIACYAATEPGGGSDVASIRTRAEKKGDQYVLNGQKMWITGAGLANWMFVLARTIEDPKSPPSRALTGFIVEADTPGITVGRKEDMMGQRCCDTRGITFEDVVVPKENVIAGEGRGFQVAMGAFDGTRPCVAALGVGLSTRALHEAAKYSTERKTFGQPICEHQAVTFMLADMAVSIELARTACLKAGWELDNGRSNTFQASIAKCFTADIAQKCASDCVQIFGGAGYSREYPVEKLIRDAKILQIYEGTSQIQRMIISREVVVRSKHGQL